ncbi:hypothetical protein [Bacillus sp. ISL-45]|uniref:ImmA/IrrE family metallo-endopeptidase n=1 Tax=Bacillus sp. ISL-45 TaxID=2819128 RepID=UPI001BEAE7F7|nr:hypothetical protein [Bacillus sp. ISL-45]MBT2663046.1 hypothetical protein [Bacillus sp. ISL-45]
MKSKITTSDIFDINRKSGALILGKNRLDDYATKFLNKYCKEALVNPMPLPVDEILQEMGLTVQEVSLSSNLDVFGCCLLLDAHIDVYNRETRQYTSTAFNAGTVLIDPFSEAVYGEGSKRNTLIHEALHWEKDKRYFEILEMKNKNASEKLYPILCRQSETFFTPSEGKNSKENEVRWLEWQAHRIAPRVLMPKNSFKKKALEFIQQYKMAGENAILSCDDLIDDLSSFFITSRLSVKYRLIEVGLKDTISEFVDYEDVYEEINSEKDFVKLTPVEALKIIDEDSVLKRWISEGRFVFADGYFVLADNQYVIQKDGFLHLTAKAKKNLAKCVINIREQKFTTYTNTDKDLLGYAALRRIEGVDSRLLTFHPKYQSSLKYEPEEAYKAFYKQLASYDEQEEIELMKMIGDPTRSLCECLWFLMQNRKWNYPEQFNEQTGLNKNYHGKIKNNKHNNMTTSVLIAICVGMKLSFRITEKLFCKSKNKLDYYNDPDKTYIRIMEMMPGLSLNEFNGVLEHCGIQELGSEIKN